MMGVVERERCTHRWVLYGMHPLVGAFAHCIAHLVRGNETMRHWAHHCLTPMRDAVIQVVSRLATLAPASLPVAGCRRLPPAAAQHRRGNAVSKFRAGAHVRVAHAVAHGLLRANSVPARELHEQLPCQRLRPRPGSGYTDCACGKGLTIVITPTFVTIPTTDPPVTINTIDTTDTPVTTSTINIIHTITTIVTTTPIRYNHYIHYNHYNYHQILQSLLYIHPLQSLQPAQPHHVGIVSIVGVAPRGTAVADMMIIRIGVVIRVLAIIWAAPACRGCAGYVHDSDYDDCRDCIDYNDYPAGGGVISVVSMMSIVSMIPQRWGYSDYHG